MLTFKTVNGKHIITCNGVEFNDLKSPSQALRVAYAFYQMNK